MHLYLWVHIKIVPGIASHRPFVHSIHSQSNNTMSTRSPRHNNNSSSRASILFLGGIALFAAGCGLGHWHGRILLSNTNNERWSGGNGGMEAWSTSSIHRRLDHNDTTISKQNKCLGDTKDGWHTIHVFYGMTDPIDDNEEETATSTTAGSSTPAVQEERLLLQDETYPTTVSTISIHATQRHRRRWFSQARQDEIVFALLRNKTQGYFVDLAANDAVQFSNTVALETFHNWTGVCIEPNPIYWPRLASLRTNCITIAAVVGAERMQGV